jgi:hypothetical protein
MHTDYTLQILKEIMTKLGDQFQFFANETCLAYSMVELPHKTAAQLRRKAKNAQVIASNTEETSGGTCWKKTFNMNTYKHHALGDYVQAIRTYGTCDSYSTEAIHGSLYMFPTLISFLG